MAEEAIVDLVREMRTCRVAISHACAMPVEGWRGRVVRWRSTLAEQIGRAAYRLNATKADTPAAVRDAFSHLRAAPAGHQAAWPAVSMDLDHPDSRRTADSVRAAFDRLEPALGMTARARPLRAKGAEPT